MNSPGTSDWCVSSRAKRDNSRSPQSRAALLGESYASSCLQLNHRRFYRLMVRLAFLRSVLAGLQRVTYRFYPEGRHELFNETNRNQVTRELLAWLDEATGNGNYSGRARPQPTGRRAWA
jgi:hypothetical protein